MGLTGDHEVGDPNHVPDHNLIDEQLTTLTTRVPSAPFLISSVNVKGDIIVGTGNDTVARLAAGADGKPLRADSTQPSGLTYSDINLVGDFSDRPAANSLLPGTAFFAKDIGAVYVTNGTTWTDGYLPNNDRLLPSGETALLRPCDGSTLGIATQQLRLTYFTAQRSETISQVRFYIGTASGSSPTLAKVGVWTANDAGALLTQVAGTTNDTALLTGSANARRTKSFSSSWSKVRGTRYAVGINMVSSASPTPTFVGKFFGVSQESGDSQRLAGTASSQTDLPSTLASGSISDSSSAIQFHLLG